MAAALSYLLGAVTGLVFLLREKDRPFVRFHALQSIAVTVVFVAAYAAVSVLTLVLPVVPGLGAPLAVLLGLALSLAGVALWLCLMFQAFQGREWEVPGLGARVRAFVVPAAGGDGRGGPSA